MLVVEISDWADLRSAVSLWLQASAIRFFNVDIPRNGMHKAVRSSFWCTERTGMILVCCNFARCHDSLEDSLVIFKLTRRFASSCCRARKTRPQAPSPNRPTSLKPQKSSASLGKLATAGCFPRGTLRQQLTRWSFPNRPIRNFNSIISGILFPARPSNREGLGPDDCLLDQTVSDTLQTRPGSGLVGPLSTRETIRGIPEAFAHNRTPTAIPCRHAPFPRHFCIQGAVDRGQVPGNSRVIGGTPINFKLAEALFQIEFTVGLGMGGLHLGRSSSTSVSKSLRKRCRIRSTVRFARPDCEAISSMPWPSIRIRIMVR